MFATLPESRRRARPGAIQSAGSIALHLALITWAVHATSGPPALASRAVVELPIVFPAPLPSPARDPVGRNPTRTVVPAPPAIPGVSIPIAVPIQTPTAIPAPDLGPAIDPSRLVFRDRVPQGAGAGGADTMAPPPGYLAEQVDQPAVWLSPPSPRYPPLLRGTGLEGRVLVEFVVDTLGRIEPGSWRVLEASHPAFEAALHQATLNARFRPARIRGRPVRQLVRLPARFALSP